LVQHTHKVCPNRPSPSFPTDPSTNHHYHAASPCFTSSISVTTTAVPFQPTCGCKLATSRASKSPPGTRHSQGPGKVSIYPFIKFTSLSDACSRYGPTVLPTDRYTRPTHDTLTTQALSLSTQQGGNGKPVKRGTSRYAIDRPHTSLLTATPIPRKRRGALPCLGPNPLPFP
jgi:hypothetical protein